MKVNYKNLDQKNFKIVKDPEKKITYYLNYNEEKWTLKLPSSNVLNDVVKDDNYHILDIDCTEDVVNMFKSIDQYVINYVVENSEKIYSKKQSKTKIEDQYKYTIKHPSCLRLRINDSVKIYDKVGQSIDGNNYEEMMKADDKLGLLIHLDSIRIGNGIIKCNWYASQLKLNRVITDCEISDSESDDGDDTDTY